MLTFFQLLICIFKVENVNVEGQGFKKKSQNLVNVIKERPLNLRKFFTLVPISKKRCQITPLSIFSVGVYYIVLRGVILNLFFGDWSQSEKLSEIKPPLLTVVNPPDGKLVNFTSVHWRVFLLDY
jgi:hypothetical protein